MSEFTQRAYSCGFWEGLVEAGPGMETETPCQHSGWGDRVLPTRQMDIAVALQKLASYRPRRNPTYKKTFDDGLPLLDNDGWKRRTDSKARVSQ